MRRKDSRAEYRRRMYRVLEYIDRYLDQPLELHQLAEVACFSPYHFHRLFTAWMGMTLGDYLHRRRIEMGAWNLIVQTERSILDVALSVGFGSGEAFSRAFRRRFGEPPMRWRERVNEARAQNRKFDQVHSNLDQMLARLAGDNGCSMTTKEQPEMNVKLTDLPATKVAYLRYTGPYGPGVGEFWDRTFWPWVKRHGLTGLATYGIGHDNPATTDPAQCRYDACVELPDGTAAPADAKTMTLPGGHYAVHRFKGTAMEIGQTWDRLLCDWLPDSGLQLEDRPCFEYYPADARFDEASGVFECDICLPVAELETR